ncbi:MAG: protein kinase [Marinicellaceae bacterium]
MTNKTEKIIKSLKLISQSSLSEREALINQFKKNFPDDLDWLQMFDRKKPAREVNQFNAPNIDGFEIIKTLGSGANGKVFLALKGSNNQKVAIKVPMKFLSKDQLHRFTHESQLLSRLSHNNIAQLFETGYLEKDQLPYIVMEHIDGVTINHYCDDNNLTRKDIIQLFYQVLEAVQYAHNRGIVHRDIKPENILVTHDGVVKLLDFGIALATDNSTQHLTQLTKTGEIVGTLAYMSPEQVSGINTIDTRADVYSLGVVLYQLLSKGLPHKLDANQIFSAISKIIEDQPKKISTLASDIDEDLAKIVHHSIEKNPDERYQSPRDFKKDLDNYLSGHAISVKNSTLWQNLKYISRKHKALVSGSLLAVMGLITGLIFAVSFAFKEQEARKIAETNAKTSAHTSHFINQLLTSADPDNIFGEQLTVLQVIDNAEFTIKGELEDAEPVEANIRTTLASVYTSLGQYEKAQYQIDTVEKLLLDLTEMEDYLDFHFTIKFIQSKLYSVTNKVEENITLLKQLEKTTANHPLFYAKTQAALGNAYLSSGDIEKSKSVLTEIINRKYEETNKEFIEIQLFAKGSYAVLLTQTGDFAQAKEMLEQLLEQRIQTKGETHIQTSSVLNSLANVESNLGNYSKAQSLTEQVIKNRQALLGDNHISTINSKVNLISILVTSNQLVLADEKSKKLLKQMEDNLGELHKRTLQLKNIRAYLLEDLNKPNEAEALYRSTLNAYAKQGINKGPELFALQNNLAMLLMNKNSLQESEEMFSQLLDNVRGILGEEHIYYAIFIGNFGELLLKQKQYAKAEPLLQMSYEKLVTTFGENHKRTLKAQKRLEQLANKE